MCKTLVTLVISIALIDVQPVQAAPVCLHPVGKIVSAQGQVDVQEGDSSEWRLVKMDDTLCSGLLRTEKDSRVTLALASGAEITLPENSTINLAAPSQTDADPKQRLESWLIGLLNGKLFVRSRQPQRFQINTPFINAVHEGTEFLVAVSDQQAEISVFDGKVSGENKQGRVKIGAGFKAVASANVAPRLEPLKITPEDAVQWSLYYPPIIDASALDSDDISLNPALIEYRNGNIKSALNKLDAVPLAHHNNRFLALKAAFLLSVGKLDEAEPLIRQILQNKSKNSEALALEAVIAVAKNHQEQATDLSGKAVDANPTSPVAKIAQSYAYQAAFNIEEALKSAQDATRLSQANALAWARVAELQLSLGDHNAAVKSAQTAQSLNPKLSRTHTVLGFANLAETEINQGKKAFQEALTLDSSDPLARLGFGLAKIRQGDVEEGKTELEAAVNLDPNNAIIRSYLGKAYYELRNKDFAGKEYELAKTRDPKDPTPFFYDAIRKQTVNRPVQALHDMQKASELNDNRAVYRSKLLLDSDSAARSASLGRIYNDLGFQQRGLLEGWNSINQDPGNYSAHRLLADNYAVLPRHEVARVSELLKAQLLQPVNITPVQPQAAESNILILDGLGPTITSFNEYNPLYARNRFALQTSGFYGSRDTISDEVVQSGVWDKFSYSLGQFHYQTDGFRPNNGQKRDMYNVFAQAQVTSDTNVQVELRRLEETTGDINQGFYFDNFSPDTNSTREINSVRGGLHHKFSENSDLLASIIHRAEQFRVEDSESIGELRSKGTQYEMQHLYRHAKFDVTGGLNYLDDEPGSIAIRNKGEPAPYSKQENRLEHGAFYVYSNIKIIPNLTMLVGLSQDFYRARALPILGPSQAGLLEQNPLNPKFGLTWQASKATTVRFAALRALKRGIIQKQTLEPTHIAGFNQFYDDLDGTLSTRIGLGVDHKFYDHLLIGAEFSRRHLEAVFQSVNSDSIQFNKTNWNEENARAYINWTPTEQLALGANYTFEGLNRNDQFYDNLRNQFGFFNDLATHKAQLFGNYFHPNGFISRVSLTFVNQSGDIFNFKDEFSPIHPETSRFWLLDAEIGYRMPRRYGLVSLGIKNLLDEHYNFQGIDLNTSMPVQGRYLYSRLTLSF